MQYRDGAFCRISQEELEHDHNSVDGPDGTLRPWTQEDETLAVELFHDDDYLANALSDNRDLIRDLQTVIPCLRHAGKRVKSVDDLMCLDATSIKSIANKAIQLINALEDSVMEAAQ